MCNRAAPAALAALALAGALPAGASAKSLGPPPTGLQGATKYGTFSVAPSFAVARGKRNGVATIRTTITTTGPNGASLRYWTHTEDGQPSAGPPGIPVGGSGPYCGFPWDSASGSPKPATVVCTYKVGGYLQWRRIGVQFCGGTGAAPPGPLGRIRPFGQTLQRGTSPGCENAEDYFAVVPPGTRKPSAPNPDGLDWRMPPRLDGEVKTWTASEGLPARNQVHPDQWKVNLFLTKSGNALSSCPSGGKWEWKVTAPKGAKVVGKPKAGCTTSMDVSDLGTYHVTAVNSKTRKRIPGDVVVKDWLLVGLGDSNGSGEGNPPFQFEQCNRTEASYQFQTAQYVESHDPRSSVTFVFAACSGAIIEDLYRTSYSGINPGAPLDPQIKQAARLIDEPLDPPSAQRHVDGAIVSIGVNNIAFGPLVFYCISNFSLVDACERKSVVAFENVRGGTDRFESSSAPDATSLQAQIDSLVTALPPKYGPLAKALSAPLDPAHGGTLGVKPGHVVVTQYPDFTRGTDGQPCSGTIGPQSTWAFVGTAAAGLNAAVAGSILLYEVIRQRGS